MAWMDLQGLKRRLKNMHSIIDILLEKIIEEHVTQNDPNVKQDLLHVLLAASANQDMEPQITRDNIKAVIYVCKTCMYNISIGEFRLKNMSL